MSPRRTRGRRRGPDRRSGGTGAAGAAGVDALQQVEEWSDGDWVVVPVTGSAATKTYRCPGCDHEIRPATPHLVTWPAEDFVADWGGVGGGDEGGEAKGGRGLGARRHWHRPCWRARGRRGPRRRR